MWLGKCAFEYDVDVIGSRARESVDLENQNKISTQKRVEKNVSDTKKHSYPKVTPKIGGFLYAVGFVLLMATYQWIQIFSL